MHVSWVDSQGVFLENCHGAHSDGAPVCVTGILRRTSFELGLIRTAI